MRANERAAARGRFNTCPGSKVHIRYEGQLQENGELKLIEVGRDDIQQMIEADRMKTELSVILDKFNAGDISVLHRYNPQYADVSGIPRSLIEAQNLLDSLKEDFNLLPIEIKNKFHNDYYKWIGSYGNSYWMSAMGISPIDQSSEKSEDSEAGVARSGAAAEGE